MARGDSEEEREQKRRRLRKQVGHPYITRQYIEVPKRLPDTRSDKRVDPGGQEDRACDCDD
ncbi:MAG: acyl-coenzyme A synthetase/AMP-(fatty) acid ligase [Candidatus Latescibacterota bacterium]|jgi:acyl-coenzyme A synthetase/AMP-(fatty) acid ligase